MPDDVRACLVHPQHDQLHLVIREPRIHRELPHEVPHGTQIGGMTGELDLSLHREWKAGMRPFTRKTILSEGTLSKFAVLENTDLNKTRSCPVLSPARPICKSTGKNNWLAAS
jgi:hypothetical protein